MLKETHGNNAMQEKRAPMPMARLLPSHSRNTELRQYAQCKLRTAEKRPMWRIRAPTTNTHKQDQPLWPQKQTST